MLTRSVFALVIATLAGCSSTPKHPIAVAVLFDGERTPIAATSVGGLELHPIELAADPPPPEDRVTAALGRARTAYAAGNHDACRSELSKIDIPQLLATGNRAAAARTLALETGCAFQGQALEDAKRAAARLAAFGLDLPADAIAREAEDLIISSIAASSAKRTKLDVAGQTGARVSIDGRPAMCTVPCAVDLGPGEHVIAVDADGFEPAWQIVRMPATAITVAQQPASATRATAQWRTRLGRGLPATDVTGASLIALAAREPRVAYLHGGAQLTGTLIVDGKPRATGNAARDGGARLVRELAYDGGLLQRPKAWQRPWFWIAVTAATLAVSGAIVYVTYEPEIQTMVGF